GKNVRPATGCARGARGLGPATVWSMSATSSAVRATGPVTWRGSHTQSLGWVGTSPTDGRMPTTPQNEAGSRSDPPRTVPQPRDRVAVLDPHGQRAQEAGGLGACQPPLQVAGVVQRSRVERDDRVDRWVVALEPLQTRLDDLEGGDLALGDERPQLDGREIS